MNAEKAKASIVVRPVAMALAGAALVMGMWGGLQRLGLKAGVGFVAAEHGPLMVAGFLGTLIGLERAVAHGSRWGYLAPLASGLGGALLIMLGDDSAARLLLLVGAIVLAVIMLDFTQRQPSSFVWIMALGSLGLVLGNGLWWRGMAVPRVVPAWVMFLFLTVAGERLELSRMVPAGGLRTLSLWLAALNLIAGSLLSIPYEQIGWRLSGLGLAAGSFWLLHYDIAWRTRRRQGLPRYMALAVLAASSWTMVAGVMVLVWGRPEAGFLYDAFLHASFLGFGLGMVMAHAPMMAPIFTGGEARYTPALYFPVALLHLSTGTRVASDLLRWQSVRSISGLVNVVAILLFVLVMIVSVVRARNE